MNKTAQDQATLLKNLPALLKLVTAAQEQLTSISANLELAQTGVLRSSLPSENGEPRFTSQFVEYSGEFAACVVEFGDNFERLAESIHQLDEASKAMAFGVRHQLQVEVQADNDPLDEESKTLLRFSALAAL